MKLWGDHMGKGLNLLKEVLQEEIDKKRKKEMANNKKQPMTRQTDDGLEKWCAKCKDYHPCDSDHFYKDSGSGTGFGSYCKMSQLKGTKKGAAPAQKSIDGEPVIRLDLSAHEDLLAEIKATAEKEFRTVEMQVLWWLYNRKKLGMEGAI